MVERKK
jgi:hypothetical protein